MDPMSRPAPDPRDPMALHHLGLEATEQEIKRAISDPAAVICEWPTSGLTFVLSLKERVILRTGALGGDVREIHGGWRYLKPADCLKEWEEIKSLEPNFQRQPRKGPRK